MTNYLRVGFGPSYHKPKWIMVGKNKRISTVCGMDSVMWNVHWLPSYLGNRVPCKRCFPQKPMSVVHQKEGDK